MIQSVNITVEYDENNAPVAIDVVHRSAMNEHQNPANAMRILEMATLELAKYLKLDKEDLKNFEMFRIDRVYDHKITTRFNAKLPKESDFDCEDCKDSKTKVIGAYPVWMQIIGCDKCRPKG